MKTYIFTTEEQNMIVNHFGAEFFETMQITLQICTEKWCLCIDSLIPLFSVNCIFACHSVRYGEAILKIGWNHHDATTESAMLNEYNGQKFCRLYESNIKNGALLIEKLSPGKNLFCKTTAEQRITAFAELYNSLHLPARGAADYPTYRGWIGRFIKLTENRNDIKEHGIKALNLYDELVRTYSKTMLLHGDIHHYNIISDGDGYRLIDPKGVIGDPVFDCSRFIIQEFDDDLKKHKYADIKSFTRKLGEAICIPPEVLFKCLYIETVIWMGEDLFFTNWLDDNVINNVVQAEILMKSIHEDKIC